MGKYVGGVYMCVYIYIHTHINIYRYIFIYVCILNSEPLVQFRSRQSDKTEVALVLSHTSSSNINVESQIAARTMCRTLTPPSS